MFKNRSALFIVLGLAVLCVVSVFIIMNRTKKGYEAIPLKKASLTEAIYGLGTVKSNQVFSFKVGVPKTLQSVFVQEGDSVKKGTALASFDDGMKVISPIDGTVSSLPFHAGENVFTDRPMVVVENLRDVFVEARLDQQGSLRVKPGLQVRLSFESLRQTVFKGEIKSLYPSQGEFVARIEVKDLPEIIIPGMTSDVAIEVAEKESVLLVPVRAISGGHVLRERSGERERIPLQIGISNDEWAEVTSGDLQVGDFVLIKR